MIYFRLPMKVLFLTLALIFCNAQASVAAGTDAELRKFVHDRLVDAVLLYDRHFRVNETGQYVDAIMLNGSGHTTDSSIASTGMGLISLAIGDALGVIENVEEKAETTLTHLLGRGASERFKIDRSKNGWFRHWFDARTGRAPHWNGDKFSTIDTAILGAGAAILQSYLAEKAEQAGEPPSRAAELAQELVMSVDWTTAIRNSKRGSIHLVFFGPQERETKRVASLPFDEYALLPCMAASYEKQLGVTGVGTKVWKARFGAADDLPMATYENYTLLGKRSGAVPSHFTHQFAFYLCGAYARDPAFINELAEVMEADRQWFEKAGGAKNLWGLGAGSELVFDQKNRVLGQRYEASRLKKNEQGTASPAIMAGFLAVDEARGQTDILSELTSLWADGHCRYHYRELGFMWRCAPRAPEKRVTRVEGVDFSTWVFGLAAAHPEIGLRFFQRHGF